MTRQLTWPLRSPSPQQHATGRCRNASSPLGEIGLAGELRRVPGTDRRLNEAARLGSAEAVIPADLETLRSRP